MAKIEITAGLSLGRTFELSRPETVVGRHPNCDLQLRETTVSRRHARIIRKGDAFFVEDLGSQHGTQLNGQRVFSATRLRDGDRIAVSDCEMQFIQPPPDLEDVLSGESQDRSTILSSLDMIAELSKRSATNAENKLQALLEIIHNLGVSLDTKQIFPKLLESIFRIFPSAHRGYVLLADPLDERRLTLQAMKQRDENSTARPSVSRTIARAVMNDGRAIISGDAGQDERFKASESIGGLGIHSVMCVPLVGSSGKPMGMIHIDSQDVQSQFVQADLEVLVNIANLAGKALEHARLHETQLQFDRRERDLNTARQVQRHFLPQERPTIADYQLFDYYAPADAVGGDYFGYIELPDGRLAVAVGDVAGKGVQAALLMARLCSDVRYCLATTRSPSIAMRMLNRLLTKQVEYGNFITFAMCVLDPAKHTITAVNAGHLHPLLRRAKTHEVEFVALDVKGPPLGIDAEHAFDEQSYTLEPGDAVLLYTDGVNEAINVHSEQFGHDRVKHLLAQPGDAPHLIESILKDLRAFTQGAVQVDDTCLVSLSRNDPS